MASRQDEHRNKRVKTEDETVKSPSSSATPLASRPNAQSELRPLPRDSLSTQLHKVHLLTPQSHNPRVRVSRDLTDDTTDYSSSKGKERALPMRERAKRVFPAKTNKSISEDAVMRDATSHSADEEDGEGNLGESDYQHGGDGMLHHPASKGKGKALRTSERSSPEASNIAENISNGDAHDMDMRKHGDQHLKHEDREDRGDNGDRGRYGVFDQLPQAQLVDPPVQEIREKEDGTWDIRPEGVSESE